MVEIVGNLGKAKWYKYPDGSIFSFHVVITEPGKELTFRSDFKTWPSVTLKREFGIEDYMLIRNAIHDEVTSWHYANGVEDENLPEMVEV